MLVRKFLRCKITDRAKDIIERLELQEGFGIYEIYLDEEDRKMIVKSLYETERTWEMEP